MRFPLTLAAALLGIALTGCGGKSSSAASTPATPGGPSVEAQLATLNAALGRVQALVGKGPSYDYLAVRQELLKDPAVQVVGTDPENGALWIAAGDGPMAVVAIDPTPISAPPATAVAPAAPSIVARVRTEAAAAAPELPGAATYRLYMGVGNAFTDPTPDLARILQARGYTAATSAAPTVEELRSGPAAGVFFIKTHGARLTASGGRTGTPLPYYAIYTATPYPDAGEEVLLAQHNDWLTRRVVIFEALNQRTWTQLYPYDTHYAVTDAFVASYLTMAPNGVVLVNACNSGSGQAQAFADAFMKTAAVYMGWGGLLDGLRSDDAARYLFDRLTGANDAGAAPESPPQRPFDLGALATDMGAKGLASIPPATFVPLGNGVLAPSIQRIDVDEQAKTLTFRGIFGSRGDTVSVANQSLSISSWSPTTIVTSLPAGGGDALVTVGGRKSNTVQLTDWSGGTFTYDLTAATSGGTLKQGMTWTPHFRADLHAWRDQPGVAPVDRQPLSLVAAQDSKCHYSASGADVQKSSSVTWAADGDLPTSQAASSGSGCIEIATLDPRAGAAAVPTMVYGRAVQGLAITVTPPGVTIPSDLIPDPAVYTVPATWGLALTRDDAFDLVAGTSTPTPVVINSGTVQGLGTLSWTQIGARFPPDPQAAR